MVIGQRASIALVVGRAVLVGGYAFGDIYRRANAQPRQRL